MFPASFTAPWPPSCTLFHVLFPASCTVPCHPSCTLVCVPCICSLATFLDSVPCSLHPEQFPFILPLPCSMFPASSSIPWPPSCTLFHVPCILYCSLTSFPYSVQCYLHSVQFPVILPIPCSMFPLPMQAGMLTKRHEKAVSYKSRLFCLQITWDGCFFWPSWLFCLQIYDMTVSYQGRLVCLQIDIKRLFLNKACWYAYKKTWKGFFLQIPAVLVCKLHGMAVSFCQAGCFACQFSHCMSVFKENSLDL